MMLNWKETPLGWQARILISRRNSFRTGAQPTIATGRARHGKIEMDLSPGSTISLDIWAAAPELSSSFQYTEAGPYVGNEPTLEYSDAAAMKAFEGWCEKISEEFSVEEDQR